MKEKTKYCPKCEKKRLRKFFNRNITSRDGLQGRCRDCHNDDQREIRSRNRERNLARERDDAQKA